MNRTLRNPENGHYRKNDKVNTLIYVHKRIRELQEVGENIEKVLAFFYRVKQERYFKEVRNQGRLKAVQSQIQALNLRKLSTWVDEQIRGVQDGTFNPR